MYNFTLYMTTDCNFKCQYCYEDYHNHYQLNEKTLVDSLEFMMNYGDRGKVLIDFLGGEPLLKKELIYQAVAYIKDNYPEREVKYYITTNCSLMDDRFIAFMKENRFTVRLSFDGNKETHDLNRVAKDEVSCYDKIFENIMKVKDSGLNFSVRMTVTENTIPYMFENICYLHEHGLDNIADEFLYKKDFETALFLRIAMETGIRSIDIPYIEWSCIYGKAIYLEESKGGDLYKRVNGTFPKISTQSLRIIKLLHRKQGKIFTKSNEYYVRKISCAWGMPGFRIHSFQDYRRKIEMGTTVGVQVPRIIPL